MHPLITYQDVKLLLFIKHYVNYFLLNTVTEQNVLFVLILERERFSAILWHKTLNNIK